MGESVTYPENTPVRREAFGQHLLILAGLKPNTIKAYVRDLELWQASGLDVETWAIQGANSPSTVVRRLAGVKRFCKFSKVPDLTADIPRPKARHGVPRPVESVEDKIANLTLRPKLAAIVLLESGLRISEAYSLSFGRDEWAPEQVVITGKGGKDRMVFLSKRARFALFHLGGRMPWSKVTLQRYFREQGFTPHKLRHTFATRLAASGADLGEVQDLLGHASPATTRNYMAYGTERLQGALTRMQSHFGGDAEIEDEPEFERDELDQALDPEVILADVEERAEGSEAGTGIAPPELAAAAEPSAESWDDEVYGAAV